MKKLFTLSTLLFAFMIWIQSCEDAINSEDNILKKPDNDNTQQNDILDKLDLSDIDFSSAITGRENIDTSSCITNTSDSIEIVINSLEITGPDAKSFGINGINLPVVLAPKEKYCLYVTFYPEETRTYEAKIVINGDEDYFIKIIGNADTFLKDFKFEDIDFGNMNLGDVKEYNYCITNTLDEEINIHSMEIDNSAFRFTDDITYPVQILPDQEYCLMITFDPPAKGTYEGRIIINEDPECFISVKGVAE